MSIQFSDTTNKHGIIQLIERNLGFSAGRITNDATLFSEFTSEVNIGVDEVFAEIFYCGGTWQFDDSNHTDYPIITTNLVLGQRDYTFTTDEQGNLILDIYKVLVADSSGVFHEMTPKDAQSEANTSGFWNGQDTQGTPTQYDKTANGIFLDAIPNYNYTNGLKIYINREGSYFTTSDTTKKPGFSGLFHEYLAIRASYQYAWRKTMPIAVPLEKKMIIMLDKIKKHYGQRERDIKRRLVTNVEDNH